MTTFSKYLFVPLNILPKILDFFLEFFQFEGGASEKFSFLAVDFRKKPGLVEQVKLRLTKSSRFKISRILKHSIFAFRMEGLGKLSFFFLLLGTFYFFAYRPQLLHFNSFYF